jgi:hypothetical protein
MGIFDLPPVENRKYNDSIFFKPIIINREYIIDPDFYIIYRVGVVMRVWSFILASCAFVLAYVHSYSGFMPELFVFYDKPMFLSAFNGFINIAGTIMVVLLLYYFALFFKYVNFKEYNILRYGDKTTKGKGLKVLISIAVLPFICLLCMTYIGGSFDYFSRMSHSLYLYNNVPFVFCLYLFSVFALSICSQAFFLISLMCLYAIYERIFCND